jgi:hypothetical protein
VTYSFGEWIADAALAIEIEKDKARALAWKDSAAGGYSEYWYQVYWFIGLCSG